MMIEGGDDNDSLDLGLQLSSQESFKEMWNIVESDSIYTQIRDRQNMVSFSDNYDGDQFEMEGEQTTFEVNISDEEIRMKNMEKCRHRRAAVGCKLVIVESESGDGLKSTVIKQEPESDVESTDDDDDDGGSFSENYAFEQQDEYEGKTPSEIRYRTQQLRTVMQSCLSNNEEMADMVQMANNPNQVNTTRGNYGTVPVDVGSVLPDTTRNSAIPSNTNYLGPYNFEIEFLNQPEKVTKSTSWTYSEQLDKLYVDMGVSCIICFKVKKFPPAGSIIRALPIYERAEHVSHVVKRCPTHSLPTDQSNKDHVAPEHFVRCESDQTLYYEDPSSGRQSVEVPFVRPQAGNDSSQYLFSFMCLGSCPGGPNRRPIKMVFTLENAGMVLGRRSLSVRVCACPGRDRKTDEKNLLCPKEAKQKSAHPTLVQTSSADLCVAEIQSKKRKMDDDDMYTIMVRGRANYNILMQIKQALELQAMVPKDKIVAYQNEQKQLLSAGMTTSLSNVSSTSKSALSFGEHVLANGAVSVSAMAPDESEIEMKKAQLKKSESVCIQDDTSRRVEESRPSHGHVKKESPESIESWLTSIGMAEYLNLFTERGLLQMSQLEDFTEDDLCGLRIGDAHRSAIWRALQLYSSSLSSWSSSQQSGWSCSPQNSTATSGQPSIIRFQRIRFKRVASLKKNDHDYSS